MKNVHEKIQSNDVFKSTDMRVWSDPFARKDDKSDK